MSSEVRVDLALSVVSRSCGAVLACVRTQLFNSSVSLSLSLSLFLFLSAPLSHHHSHDVHFIFTAAREEVSELNRKYEKTEDDLKALQSVGQIIGEVLRPLTDEKCKSCL